MPSFFNYSLQRPYPFKWFTPVAITGGLILLGILSILNFVSSSYTYTVKYVKNPNTTVSDGGLYSHWPSLLTSSVVTSCKPANFPFNAQLFTNQTGLTWTVTSVTQDNDSPQALSSLPYQNNRLEHCNASGILMSFQEGTTPFTPWDIESQVFVTCEILGSVGLLKVNMTAIYDLNSLESQQEVMGKRDVFVASNRKDKASMYWAEWLGMGLWYELNMKVWNATTECSPRPNRGTAAFITVAAQKNIVELDFFNVTFGFSVNGDWVNDKYQKYLSHPISIKDLEQLSRSNSTRAQPRIWSQADAFAKVLYSTVLTDLGQTQLPMQSNIFTNASVLDRFIKQMNDHAGADFQFLREKTYTAVQRGPRSSGPLEVTPSVIVTRYLCQVPVQKPIGAIFISVLLADLVFLHTAWQVYKFGVNQFLKRSTKHSDYSHCEGCSTAVVKEIEDLEVDVSTRNRPVKRGDAKIAILALGWTKRAQAA